MGVAAEVVIGCLAAILLASAVGGLWRALATLLDQRLGERPCGFPVTMGRGQQPVTGRHSEFRHLDDRSSDGLSRKSRGTSTVRENVSPRSSGRVPR